MEIQLRKISRLETYCASCYSRNQKKNYMRKYKNQPIAVYNNGARILPCDIHTWKLNFKPVLMTNLKITYGIKSLFRLRKIVNLTALGGMSYGCQFWGKKKLLKFFVRFSISLETFLECILRNGTVALSYSDA